MSFTEILILGVIGLIVLGPEELPGMARKLAKFVNELRRVKDDILGPLTDTQQSTAGLIKESREAMHKELVELVNMRNQLEQEISRRETTTEQKPTAAVSQKPSPPPEAIPQPAAPVETPPVAATEKSEKPDG